MFIQLSKRCVRRSSALVHSNRSQLGPLQLVSHRRPVSRLAVTPTLKSWDLQEFRTKAFLQDVPYQLPRDTSQLSDAQKQCFVYDNKQQSGASQPESITDIAELRTAFWAHYQDAIVPLELTLPDANKGGAVAFHRSMFPTPDLVKRAGKGDVYDSSLWLGRSPTYTPLHRDPNPNLFIQLAGRKMVRLLPPDVGDAVLDMVQQVCRDNTGSTRLRGEEMMAGEQRVLLEAGIWDGQGESRSDAVTEIQQALLRYGQEADLGLGQGLFIPRGWWHSVKGVGSGITASVNWWFR
jgi:hypothetical protein